MKTEFWASKERKHLPMTICISQEKGLNYPVTIHRRQVPRPFCELIIYCFFEVLQEHIDAVLANQRLDEAFVDNYIKVCEASLTPSSGSVALLGLCTWSEPPLNLLTIVKKKQYVIIPHING
jgi:hypothetical protein